jgi:hypothetical protein
MAFINEAEFIALLEGKEFNLIRSLPINNKITFGDLFTGYFDEELFVLLKNKEIISKLFKLSEVLFKYNCYCGGFDFKARYGYEVKNSQIGLKFIPKGLLTYKLLDKTLEFQKNYGCYSYVCDEYIYLGLPFNESVINDKKTECDPVESAKAEKAKQGKKKRKPSL